MQAQKPLLRSGRLLLGQAFLYDRATGLRLWSRQLPEFPASGLLAVDDPFLAYGVVTDPALTAELPLEVRATKASAAFTQRMFEPLAPARSSEDHEARARLTATDLEADIQKEALLDERQLGLEVALGYGGETAGATVTSKEETIAELHTGAIAPSGVLRIGPQLTYRGTTRFVFTAMANVGLAPGSFGRTYYRDGATQNPGAPSNQIVPVQIAGVTLVGAEVRGGYAFLLSPAWTLAPTAGAFFDAWSLDSDTLADTTHLRFGLVGGIDALWLPSPDGLFYVRGGPVLRLGADSVGPLVFGLGLSLGLGIRL